MISCLFGSIIASSFRLRYDGNPKLKYFQADEYGCKSLPFSFYSEGNLLRGEKIYSGDLNKINEIIIFFHGAGAGRTAYMREMCYFAKRGFLVYCYDNTGCMESEGRFVIDLGHSVIDAESFFEYLATDELTKGKHIYAMGHSWGGLAVKYCLGHQGKVERFVSLAGLVDLARLYREKAKMPLWTEKPINRYLSRRFGNAASEGLRTLENASKPFMFIVGDHDEYGFNLPEISKISLQNPNISYKLIKNQNHQCYWTKEGSSYFKRLMEKGFGSINDDPSLSLDYGRLEDDASLMEEIVDFLRR